MKAWDEAVFRWINGWPDGWTPLFYTFSQATKWTWVRIGLLALIVAMLVRGQRSRLAVSLSLLAVALANETTDVLKAWLQAVRPCVELPDVTLRVGLLSSYGTASAHSANMAAVAFVMTRYLGRWGYLWIGVAFLTGLSRVYVGVHYPYQVVFGWATGVFAAWVVTESYEVWMRIRKRKGPTVGEMTESDAPEQA
ncbi:MAG: hypothetical protein AMXMBFR19_08300 [Chthonomonadaceae bacterium]|uniref:Phosphatase PAP2 family n=1 Tax=Candidatus Nitrosymbiomonas proteolyticus TaxID=2608984 RepID=A0A809R9E3_9BACT|nr:phosphatase PAP2 family [Candidatus Nitrosymbiomonas proteolyticus]